MSLEHLFIKRPVPFHLAEIDLAAATDDELKALSGEMGLSLSLEEMRRVRDHFKGLGRRPTDVELESIAQAWSEHCCYKSSKVILREHIFGIDNGATNAVLFGGLVGDLMAARMPNAAGIQLQAFCMGVNDLERAVNATKSGRNAYCGDFDQGIRAARKMVRGPENDGVYDTAQALATAAERIKSIEFNAAKHVGWGLGAAEKLQTMSCN